MKYYKEKVFLAKLYKKKKNRRKGKEETKS